MSAFASQGDYLRAESLLDDVISLGLAPDAITFNSLISAHARALTHSGAPGTSAAAASAARRSRSRGSAPPSSARRGAVGATRPPGYTRGTPRPSSLKGTASEEDGSKVLRGTQTGTGQTPLGRKELGEHRTEGPLAGGNRPDPVGSFQRMCNSGVLVEPYTFTVRKRLRPSTPLLRVSALLCGK